MRATETCVCVCVRFVFSLSLLLLTSVEALLGVDKHVLGRAVGTRNRSSLAEHLHALVVPEGATPRVFDHAEGAVLIETGKPNKHTQDNGSWLLGAGINTHIHIHINIKHTHTRQVVVIVGCW